MTYTIQIISADYQQLATGVYGTDNLPPAFVEAAKNKDQAFFIRHAAPLGSINKNGKFRRKCDALTTMNNIEKYNFYGIGFNRAKNGQAGHGIQAKVI